MSIAFQYVWFGNCLCLKMKCHLCFILSYHIIRSGSVYKGAAEKVIEKTFKMAGLRIKDIQYIISTGHGKARTFLADDEVTEITCHALGAK